MGQIDNLNKDQTADIWKAIRELQTAAPNNHSAIGRDGLEVYDGGVITITNGGLSVTGTATVLGTLIASGIINFTGTVTISGPLTVSGLTTVTNNLVVASGGKITAGTIELNPDGSAKFGTFLIDPAGKVTLANDLTVTTGGKVKVGTAMTLTPATDGGAIEYSTGAKLSSGSGAVTMYGTGGTSSVTAAATSAGMTSGSCTAVVFNDGTWRMGSSTNNIDALTAGQVTITASAAAKLASGSNSVAVTPTGITITGPLQVNSNITATGNGTFNGVFLNPGITTTTNPANIYINSSFRHYLVSSAARYKIDPQPMDLPDSLLDVPVEDWWDKGEYDRGEAKRRVPGAIAEKVEAAGGERFITYNAENDIQGIAYDRYALARTEILKRQLDAALVRIKDLEDAAA